MTSKCPTCGTIWHASERAPNKARGWIDHQDPPRYEGHHQFDKEIAKITARRARGEKWVFKPKRSPDADACDLPI